MEPFLKWAGGKRWLRKTLSELPLAEGGLYIEPFLGSGAAYFDRLPSKALLADSNAELIEAYMVVKENHEALQAALSELAERHSDEYYYVVRKDHPSTSVGRAARFLYLNRTCWNGLYRVNKKGEFNVPRGTKNLIMLPSDDFEAASSALKNAEIFCSDFEYVIDKANHGDLVYCDPPYTVHHNFNGFLKYNETIFSWADQVRLKASLLRASERGANVAVSNARHPSILELYSGFGTRHDFDRASVISGLNKGRGSYAEVLICG